MMTSYLTSTGRFLPGEPVSNEEVDDYLGTVGPNSEIVRDQTLANNGIKARYYAIDKQQRTVVSDTAMAVGAIREALGRDGLDEADIELLACASTVPDLLAPGFASMVHGELDCRPIEIVSAGGLCNAGMTALKTAHLQIAAGEKRNAVVAASEFSSRAFKSSRYTTVTPETADGAMALDVAFLRYMLSDGAGAVVLRDRPAERGISLRIDWMSLTSYANTAPTCMYIGSPDGGTRNTWLDHPDDVRASAAGALVMRQNLALLPHLVKCGVDEYERLMAEGRFDPDRITWFPAHYSSEKMKEMVVKQIHRRDVRGPRPEAWFSNLQQVGNIGCAAIFVILDELMNSGLPSVGDTMLCMVPESGRFSIAFMHLTVVGPDGAAS
jgi:3-oxoacyl-[acyl-carrier-protein] synthase-3